MFEENKTANNAAESTFEADSNTNDEKTQENLLVENDFLDCSTQGRIKTLKKNLQVVYLKMTDFNSDVSSAIEKLKSVSTFDKDTCFSDDIITAAAYAKLFDGKAFADFKSGIQNQNKKNSFLLEWRGVVKDKAANIKDRQTDLTTQKNEIQAKINSLSFIADNEDDLQGVSFPEGYSVSADGIEKVVGEKMITVCRRPIVIKSKSKNVEEKNFKFVLAYLAENGTWQELPAAKASTVFNFRKLIDLSDFGLPVTSSNANLLVDFLDAFKVRNEKILPMSLNVSRCGWYKFNDKDYFVDPRRKCFITDENRNIEIVVDDNSTFAKSLKSVGSIDEWKKAYEIAKKSPVARLIVAASVAAPLLEIFGERNFWLHINATTRAGKTTALFLAASAVGDEKIIRSFDATRNGLAGSAADVNDFCFLIDEKQVTDNRLQGQIPLLIYALTNGVGRTKLNRDSTLKSLQVWRTIVITTGETNLTDDNVTGGVYSRLLSIRAPKTILTADDCREIRKIIKENYGVAFTIFLEEVLKYGKENLNKLFQDHCEAFQSWFTDTLSEYSRYLTVLTLADNFLNVALGENALKARADAIKTAKAFAAFFPTIDEVADAPREINFVTDFIGQNQKYFVGATPEPIEKLPSIYGKFEDDFSYISVPVLKKACKDAGFDAQKVISDLVEDGFFVPDDKIPKGRKKPYPYVQKKIGTKMNCYRIPKEKISDD